MTNATSLPEYTYDDLEREIERRENSLIHAVAPATLRRLLYGEAGKDPDEVRERRRAVRDRYRTTVESAQPLLERLRVETRDARQRGAQLAPGLEDAQNDIDDYLESLAQLRTDEAEYLRESEHERTQKLETGLRNYHTFMQAKRAFDDRIEPAETVVETLREDAEPVLEYEEYLTRPAKRRLRHRLGDAESEVRALREEIQLDVLADADRQRVEDLHATVSSVASRLETYNEQFVARQRDAYQGLFTDIDDAGHDLNDAQQKAIVRNGVYNQVIAAAGTGKTFALTYRIAYLVAEGVTPSRIVALTYTNEAAKEMEQRLDEEFGITDVEVSTIHSFALGIAQDASETHRSVATRQDKRNLIEDVIREETSDGDSTFEDHYVKFLYHYHDDYLDETAFEDKTEYVAKRRKKTYETLAGEEVESQAERVIADFLFTHNVEYQYEAIAEWADTAADKEPYRPDFYLPGYNIYIEHWGLDESGAVAPWFTWSTEEYLGKLRWARGEFERTDHALVETYDFEHETGRLERALTHRLQETGVELDRMSFDEFVTAAFEYNEKENDIKQSFEEFIENAKTFDIEPDDIDERLTRRRPRQYHFGKCGQLVLARYDGYLERNDLLDFHDMIYDAIDAIETNPDEHRNRYDHLLVDEFQDVAMSQIRLIRNLVGAECDTRLFCVGDDWQSIYSFQGAAVEYFIDFEEHFGPAVETFLTENYRCPETVLEAGNDLIRNNADQIEKTVTAASGRDTTPTLHSLDGYRDSEYEKRVGEYAADLVEQFLDAGSEPSDVMILCRYDRGAPYLDNVKRELRERSVAYNGKNDHYRPPGVPGEDDDGFDEDAGAAVFSVHQSKGREAKHVVLLHAVTGPLGFPPDERDDELVTPVQEVETNTVEEERRLFYVAITRAEHDLHILTRAGDESPFVEEIEPYLQEKRSVTAPGSVGDRTTLTARVKLLWDDVHETQQQRGVLEDDTGTTPFVSWKSDDPPKVEEDVWYRFENLRVDEFQDKRQLVIESETDVTELYR